MQGYTRYDRLTVSPAQARASDPPAENHSEPDDTGIRCHVVANLESWHSSSYHVGSLPYHMMLSCALRNSCDHPFTIHPEHQVAKRGLCMIDVI